MSKKQDAEWLAQQAALAASAIVTTSAKPIATMVVIEDGNGLIGFSALIPCNIPEKNYNRIIDAMEEIRKALKIDTDENFRIRSAMADAEGLHPVESAKA